MRHTFDVRMETAVLGLIPFRTQDGEELEPTSVQPVRCLACGKAVTEPLEEGCDGRDTGGA